MKQSFEELELKRQKLRAIQLLDIDNELISIRNRIMNPWENLSLNELIRIYARFKQLQYHKSLLCGYPGNRASE